MRRLMPGLAALGLLSASCVIAPTVFHDGLPASMPAPGFGAARFEYNRSYWLHGSTSERPDEYFGAGVRVGQDWRWFCFEEGLTLLYPGAFLPCLQGGIGLREPAVTLRALWTPVSVGGRIEFDPMLWWQVSGLIGTPRKSRGFGVSYGVRASRIGIGPALLVDYTFRDIALRLEGSMTVPSPWAGANVQGRVFTIGLSAEPTKEIPKSP
jgi:hypothetical protein